MSAIPPARSAHHQGMQLQFDDWVTPKPKPQQRQQTRFIPSPYQPVVQKKRKDDSPHERLMAPNTYVSPYPPPQDFAANAQAMMATLKPQVVYSQTQQALDQSGPPQPQQEEVEDDWFSKAAQPQPQVDEWTHVTTKSKSKRQRKEPRPKEITNAARRERNPAAKNINLAKIQSDFNSKMRVWQASECRKATHGLLNRIQPEGGWRVTKAVCLGSGSFSRENGECRKRSMWQFVVVVDIARELGKMAKRDVEVYVQEPMYTDTDRAFLKTLRIHVLDVEPLPEVEEERNTASLGPAAEHLGKETFLYEPFMDFSERMVREVVEADVELYMGSSMRGLMGRWGVVGELAREFEDGHEKRQLLRFEEDFQCLEGLGIYWRKEEED